MINYSKTSNHSYRKHDISHDLPKGKLNNHTAENCETKTKMEQLRFPIVKQLKITTI